MKLTALIAAGAALTFVAAPAFAGDDEVLAGCEAYAEANEGADPAGCPCLADAAEGEDALKAEILAYEGDWEASSDDFKGAITACFPQEEAEE